MNFKGEGNWCRGKSLALFQSVGRWTGGTFWTGCAHLLELNQFSAFLALHTEEEPISPHHQKRSKRG